MSDKQFLKWIHDRIINIYHEEYDVDFLIRLRAIIEKLDENPPPVKQVNKLIIKM